MKNKIAYIFICTIIVACGSNEENSEQLAEVTQTESNLTDELPVQEEIVNASIMEDIEGSDLQELISSSECQLIDVRTPKEFEKGTIDYARNINYRDDNFTTLINELDKTKPVYVFCQRGGRSKKAQKIMEEEGFSEVYNLVGGYGKWIDK